MSDKQIDRLVDDARKEDTPPIGKMTDQDLAAELQRSGNIVRLEKQVGGGESSIPEVADKHTFKFAVASDAHLGARNQQLTLLRRFYKYAKKQKCKFVLNPGDFVEGSHKMHRDAAFGMHVHGADAQVDYVVEHYPDDLPTYGITGNHDLSHYNDGGVNVLRAISEYREDITHVGDNGAMLHMSELDVYLWHPKGGTAYARSYKPQRFIDELHPDSRPDILLTGHFHVPNHTPGQGGVEAFMCPCFKAIFGDLYIKSLGKSPVVGGLILDVGLNDAGKIQRIKTEWLISEPDKWIRDDY